MELAGWYLPTLRVIGRSRPIRITVALLFSEEQRVPERVSSSRSTILVYLPNLEVETGEAPFVNVETKGYALRLEIG